MVLCRSSGLSCRSGNLGTSPRRGFAPVRSTSCRFGDLLVYSAANATVASLERNGGKRRRVPGEAVGCDPQKNERQRRGRKKGEMDQRNKWRRTLRRRSRPRVCVLRPVDKAGDAIDDGMSEAGTHRAEREGASCNLARPTVTCQGHQIGTWLQGALGARVSAIWAGTCT